MQRDVQPELLDELPVTDPQAIRARRDLRRINAWMGNAGTIADVLRGTPPGRVAEIGAGDGEFMQRMMRRLNWPPPVLIDRQPAGPAVIEADVFDWLEHNDSDIIVANLFLHHFDSELPRLLGLIARRCRLFVACEPRRSALGLAGVRLLPLIGCGHVACYDALISVHAGFAGRELSAIWSDKHWELRETRAGLFSHLFVVRRV
jgi:hypothetical protein